MLAKWRLRASPGGYVHRMSPDEELIVIFGALHLVALALGALLFVMFLRSETADSVPPPEEEEGGGGGGNDRVPSSPRTSPPGGIPLLDAEPAGARLRSHADSLREKRGTRRPAHAPQPRRMPERR
jgi:hypothetical protein